MEQHGELRFREEVKSDFDSALEKINFSAYNPNSTEFTNALRIGLMWHLLCELDGGEADTESQKADDEIADEIMGAKKYLQRYIDSGDMNFREMASDELRHAEILLKKANSRLPTGDEKIRLKSYEAEIAEIRGKL